MRQKIELTPEQIAEALAIRKLGRWGRMDWRNVAKRMGIPSTRLRAHFEKGYRECKKQYNATQRMYIETATRPPDDVLAARDRYLSLQPISLTAALLGDPLPGRSALDRRA